MYTHKDPQKLIGQWSGERVHRAAELELYGVERPMLNALVARLQRRMAFVLSVTDEHLHITIGDEVIEGAVARQTLLH